MQRIKKGDTVMVISGAEKGQTGEVLSVSPKANEALVSGLNVRTKHVKPSAFDPAGGIQKKEAPIEMSKLMPLDPETGKPTRVKVAVVDGKKVRVAKSGKALDQ